MYTYHRNNHFPVSVWI